MEYPAFEKQLLRLIFRTSTRLSPVSVAYHLELPVHEAREHLERAVTQGILELACDDAGRPSFTCPDRPQPAALLPAVVHRPRVLALEAYVAAAEDPSPATSAALSLLMPGAGHIYCGRVQQGVAWMMATGMGYLLFIIPGLILHVCCVINAAAIPVRVGRPA
jgi:hypothetical protein